MIRKGRLLMGVASFIVVAAVGTSIWMNPPSVQRARRMDERRVADLQDLSWALSRLYEKNGSWPATLDVLSRGGEPDVRLTDPATNQPYEYAKLSDKAYRLCAVFALPSGRKDHRAYAPPQSDFSHPAGRACFKIEQTADKDKGVGGRIVTLESGG